MGKPKTALEATEVGEGCTDPKKEAVEASRMEKRVLAKRKRQPPFSAAVASIEARVAKTERLAIQTTGSPMRSRSASSCKDVGSKACGGSHTLVPRHKASAPLPKPKPVKRVKTNTR
eukprot:RCo035991